MSPITSNNNEQMPQTGVSSGGVNHLEKLKRLKVIREVEKPNLEDDFTLSIDNLESNIEPLETNEFSFVPPVPAFQAQPEKTSSVFENLGPVSSDEKPVISAPMVEQKPTSAFDFAPVETLPVAEKPQSIPNFEKASAVPTTESIKPTMVPSSLPKPTAPELTEAANNIVKMERKSPKIIEPKLEKKGLVIANAGLLETHLMKQFGGKIK
jgi:hypothetical protein